MSVWVLFLLCVVQGLTEFLPVSSSGHLLLLEQLFGVSENLMFLNLFLHIATLFAVVIVYRETLLKIIKKPFQPLSFRLLLATIFSVVLAFIYEFSGIEKYITKIYPFGFLLTSLLLLLCHIYQTKATTISVGEIGYKKSVMVGLIQGLAVVPGLSRSGSTISGLILSGSDETQASEFSFLLSIPIIVGGFCLELLRQKNTIINFSLMNFGLYFFSFLLTFFVSIVALKLTIKLLKKQKFLLFSIYTFMLFILTFILNFII